jgi:branched-chain amino acid transport system substrate-binding protein
MKNSIHQRPLSPFLVTLVLLAGTVLAGFSAQAQEPVKIGLLTPLSGTGRAYGADMVKAAELTANQINNAGGILGGRILQLMVEDSATDATETTRAARKLIDDDGVVAIAGLWGSGPTLVVRAIALEKGVAVTTVGAADAITAGDNHQLVWRFQVAAHDWGKSAAKAILADQHKKVSVLSLRNPFTSAMVQPFIDTIKAAGGEVLNHIEIDPQENPATLTQQIGEIFADNPDAVFIPAYNEQLSAIVKQTRGANKLPSVINRTKRSPSASYARRASSPTL